MLVLDPTTRWFGRAFLPMMLLLTLGCGPGYQVVPVGGTLTLNGQPVPNARISFQPLAGAEDEPGPGSYGQTDAAGKFELRVVNPDQPGAIVGTHRVRIRTDLRDDPDSDIATGPTQEYIPKQYWDGSYTVEVPSGGDPAMELKLTSQ